MAKSNATANGNENKRTFVVRCRYRLRIAVMAFTEIIFDWSGDLINQNECSYFYIFLLEQSLKEIYLKIVNLTNFSFGRSNLKMEGI
jgi:hypothetical protein